MNGTEAVVLFYIMGLFAGSTAKLVHGLKTGEIVMVKPTLSVIAESLGLKTNRKSDTERPPYWMQIVHAHGFEKALRGVVNTLKNGGQLVEIPDCGGHLIGGRIVGWGDNNTFALFNKGVCEMRAIPWKIGKELAELNTHFECGCTQNPHEGIASCTEVLEMAIKSMVEEHHRHNAYLDRLASDAEIELDAEDERRWPSRVI